MNKLMLFLSFLISLIILNACDKKAVPPIVVSKCDTVSFARHIKPIVDSNCVSCHNESFAGANFKIYNDLKEKAISGKLKAYAIDGQPKIMPLGGNRLPQNKLDLILCWINNGAKQQ